MCRLVPSPLISQEIPARRNVLDVGTDEMNKQRDVLRGLVLNGRNFLCTHAAPHGPAPWRHHSNLPFDGLHWVSLYV